MVEAAAVDSTAVAVVTGKQEVSLHDAQEPAPRSGLFCLGGVPISILLSGLFSMGCVICPQINHSIRLAPKLLIRDELAQHFRASQTRANHRKRRGKPACEGVLTWK